jgi:4-hydroxy-3-polyprenylbenzoate decarboxylase
MAYRSLRECVEDLQRIHDLVVIETEIDPCLELGMVQRRAYRAQAPALLFTNLKGCRYPALANLYGTKKRARYVLRHGFRAVEAIIGVKAGSVALPLRSPEALLRAPLRLPLALLRLLAGGIHAAPIPVTRKNAPVLATRISKDDLPKVTSWPQDGGPFITLPIVYSQSPGVPWWRGWAASNMGMYRCQLSGNDYDSQEAGLHYQLHRGIGLHHQQALKAGQPLQVQIAVGGPPALGLSAVMPLPEGLPELVFAGVLAGRGVRLAPSGGPLPILAEADFVIEAEVRGTDTKPEGPFGDHLGYYSLAHDFPVLTIKNVWARRDAIWPFTTVGRPPQEDTVFGEIIHEMTGPALPTVLPGVKGVNAVDEAGVHPLLLAIASERYEPFRKRQRPQEILTAAHAILGFGQLSLAKYLLIVAGEDAPNLEVNDSQAVFRHLLERIDFRRDLHFQTQTSIDTLDYSGSGFQVGSKVVMAACGDPVRQLPGQCAVDEQGVFRQIRVVAPGILALSGPAFDPSQPRGVDPLLSSLHDLFGPDHPAREFPLWVITEQASFLENAWGNFLWATFTRSDPATDIYGLDSFTEAKHWGCRGPLVIDARKKPHHAPELAEDPALVTKIEALAASGGALHGLI